MTYVIGLLIGVLATLVILAIGIVVAVKVPRVAGLTIGATLIFALVGWVGLLAAVLFPQFDALSRAVLLNLVYAVLTATAIVLTFAAIFAVSRPNRTTGPYPPQQPYGPGQPPVPTSAAVPTPAAVPTSAPVPTSAAVRPGPTSAAAVG